MGGQVARRRLLDVGDALEPARRLVLDLSHELQQIADVGAALIEVERVRPFLDAAVQQRRGVQKWAYSLDFNERCANVGYLLEFVRQVKDKTPRGFERIAYIEQPTARDLAAHRHNVMHEAAKLRPVVIDESLLDLDSLLLAREMGYTGAALKACKGQTQSLLMA